ncbi:histidine kinase dimerization/phospho-acceptor domain-containing protein, partial [Jatrophihabitans endophyticus]|uniref:histidine kinase dimerization/phospho-acceptor domain-containing protein n=1 Tax=Jatrophihabitans endophyticus TaxID=1206085 RepID=UPI0019FD234F
MARRPWSLATRIALLSVGIAIGTALLAGGIATGLIRSAGTDSAQEELHRLADVAESLAGHRTPMEARHRLARALTGLDIRFGVITPSGAIRTRSPLVRDALDPLERQQITDGSEVSVARRVDGHTALIEARPVDGRGIVLVQPRSDANAQSERALRKLVVALLIAAGAAVLVGLAVAWRLARPLRRTAAAAHSVAMGNRDVALPSQGPAEVVEVSEAVTSIAGALRTSEARQQQFLMSVSHDLRTPLTAISGYAESLADGVVDAADAPHVGEVLVAESKRLERMVGDLLDLARLGAADFRVELADVDVVETAR